MKYKELVKKVYVIYHKKSGKFFARKKKDGAIFNASFGWARVMDKKQFADNICRSLGSDYEVLEYKLLIMGVDGDD